MKTQKRDVVIQRLDEWRYAVAVDGLVRYVGSQEECQRRADILSPKNDRNVQDQGLVRACRYAAKPRRLSHSLTGFSPRLRRRADHQLPRAGYLFFR